MNKRKRMKTYDELKEYLIEEKHDGWLIYWTDEQKRAQVDYKPSWLGQEIDYVTPFSKSDIFTYVSFKYNKFDHPIISPSHYTFIADDISVPEDLFELFYESKN